MKTNTKPESITQDELASIIRQSGHSTSAGPEALAKWFFSVNRRTGRNIKEMLDEWMRDSARGSFSVEI